MAWESVHDAADRYGVEKGPTVLGPFSVSLRARTTGPRGWGTVAVLSCSTRATAILSDAEPSGDPAIQFGITYG